MSYTKKLFSLIEQLMTTAQQGNRDLTYVLSVRKCISKS